jgi:copper chaperone CopZ
MPHCPQCGNDGRTVKRVTLESLLHAERLADIRDGSYDVCLTPECETVYFSAGDAGTFVKSDLTVRFGLKETDPPRPICYCFDHSIEEIRDEIRRTGSSTVLDSIKEAMKGPGCRCEYTNPLGGCCLNTVKEVVQTYLRDRGTCDATVALQSEADCCSTDDRRQRDLVAGMRSFWLFWGLPIVAFILAAWLSPRPRAFVWAGALLWAGTGCFINSRRCGRLHCHITGPLWGLGGIAAFLHGLGIAPIRGSWIAIGIASGTIVAFALEWMRESKYLTRSCRSKTNDRNNSSCCTPEASIDSTERVVAERAGLWAASGSVFSAALASACCWLPLLLIAFGVSAAGVAGFFEAYRPYFIVGAVGMLGFGFYTVYFRREQCEPGSACTTSNRKLKTLNKVMLWTAAGLVGAFVFFPNYVGHLFAAPTSESALPPDVRLTTAKFRIEGMTCEGCATGLRTTLAKIPDVASVEVDYPTKTAMVRYAADSARVVDHVVEAVNSAGYNATLAKRP